MAFEPYSQLLAEKQPDEDFLPESWKIGCMEAITSRNNALHFHPIQCNFHQE